MAKGTSQDKTDNLVVNVVDRLKTADVRERTCDQARLAIGKLGYKSPLDVVTLDEFIEAMDEDALLATIRDHLNILMRRRLPKTVSRTDALESLGHPGKVIASLRVYRYNARSGEVSQATKDKRLGEATRKLMTQFGADNEDELVAILKERMTESNA